MKSNILKHYVEIPKLLPLSLSPLFGSVIWFNLSYSLSHRKRTVSAIFIMDMIKNVGRNVDI